jgi:hypothetical protein
MTTYLAVVPMLNMSVAQLHSPIHVQGMGMDKLTCKPFIRNLFYK